MGQSRSKSRGESSRRNLAKDKCAYCHQKGHWKKDCPNKDMSNAKVAQKADIEEDSTFPVSSGVFYSDGYRITLEDRNLKIVQGAFVAVKGTRKVNLYFLDGSTVIGRAVVSSSSEEKTSDSSCLWHMRLGHAREKDLIGLVKQGLLKGAKIGKFNF
uniref:CCHC-type domain-containing protein n=1 Tax=Cannabis sativa TaxID=3483 RepID=A0A803P8A9_CANSA